MNVVILIGRVTKDIELKYTPSGAAVTSFTLAIDRDYKDANGNAQTDFINCVAWKNQAEFIGNYIKKGYLIAVKGSLQIRKYDVSPTESRTVTEVIIDTVKNLTPKEKQEDQQPVRRNKEFEVDEKDLPF